MNAEKYSIHELAELLAARATISKRASEDFLKALVSVIENTLIEGESVKVRGFGTLKPLWNEARKSVNIQTGEEIILDGHYKISFVPDERLKVGVNKGVNPSDSDNPAENETPENTEPNKSTVIDPLKTLKEQAIEIKEIISEIQSLNSDKKEGSISESEKNENELEPIQFETSLDNFVQSENDQLNSKSEEFADDSHTLDHTILPIDVQELSKMPQDNHQEVTPENDSSTYIDQIRHTKRRKKIRRFLILGLILIAIIALFVFQPSVNQLGRCFFDASISKISTISEWFVGSTNKDKPVLMPKNNAQLPVVKSMVSRKPSSADTLRVLNDKNRDYDQYIASEQVQSDFNFKWAAQKYYGNEIFWGYIYEANLSRIPQSGQIPAGTLIRIPRLNAILTDTLNNTCLKKAQEIDELYTKQ